MSGGGGRLDDKVAIVVGGGSISDGIGNGRATCILFAREGARVAVLDINEAAAQATKKLIDAEGGTVMVVPVDVTDKTACPAAVTAVAAAWGPVNVLVNVVGSTAPSGSVSDVDLDLWDAGLRLNLSSMVFMARHVIPLMESAGGGSIINVSSIGGLLAYKGSALYSATKAGVMGLTRAMAADHGEVGIRVNCIAPGLVRTPMAGAHQTAGEVNEELWERRRMRSMLKSEGTGWDIGYAALFLASDESRWITGQTLVVDAGAVSLFSF